MVQKQYIPIIGTVVIVLGLAVGGFFWWHGQHKHGQNSNVGSFNSTQAQANAGGAYSNGQDISLEPTSGGLSASEGGPSGGNLGQLSQGNQSGSGGGSTQSQSSSGGSSSSGSSAFDPSTFSQYDKYKDNKDALMADVQAGNGTALSTSAGSNQASVYYKGWLTDGTLFDESHTDASGNTQSFSFTEGQHQVIAGWEEGLLGMKAGGTRLLVIPPAAGYGATGQGSIPPNSVLVFEVQLISVH